MFRVQGSPDRRICNEHGMLECEPQGELHQIEGAPRGTVPLAGSIYPTETRMWRGYSRPPQSSTPERVKSELKRALLIVPSSEMNESKMYAL
jgi:hypothetical protein